MRCWHHKHMSVRCWQSLGILITLLTVSQQNICLLVVYKKAFFWNTVTIAFIFIVIFLVLFLLFKCFTNPHILQKWCLSIFSVIILRYLYHIDNQVNFLLSLLFYCSNEEYNWVQLSTTKYNTNTFPQY